MKIVLSWKLKRLSTIYSISLFLLMYFLPFSPTLQYWNEVKRPVGFLSQLVKPQFIFRTKCECSLSPPCTTCTIIITKWCKFSVFHLIRTASCTTPRLKLTSFLNSCPLILIMLLSTTHEPLALWDWVSVKPSNKVRANGDKWSLWSFLATTWQEKGIEQCILHEVVTWSSLI